MTDDVQLLTLAEARGAIRATTTDTSRDADLAAIYIPAARKIVEDVVGPVVKQDFTATFDGGRSSIVLDHINVTVTAVSENGTALIDGATYGVNARAGIVLAGTPNALGRFASGSGNITITWTAGVIEATEDVPAGIKLAARIILAHLWQADQQGFRTQLGGPEVAIVTSPSGFALPKRAYDLLASDAQLPGFA